MSVKSFECAIARSQIGRYLAGDTVGEEAMRQLETHIADCADCQRLIDSKREELLGPLAHAPNAQEAIAGATAEETLAASTDVAAIERELRAAAARSGRAVIESMAVEAVEARELVGTVASASPAMVGGSSNEGAPVSSAPHLTVETGSAAPASSRPSPSKLGGIGAAFGKVSLPKFVRDVPEPKAEAEVIPFGPVALAREPESSPELPAMQIKAKRSLTKAGVYAGALALVLGGMAYLGNPTALLGGKAAPVAKAEKKPAAKPPAKKAIVARATGIRHSALGVPITDAAAPVSKSTDVKPAKANAAKTLVAKAAPADTHDPADGGPLEFDPSLDAPTKPAAIESTANASVAKPVAAKRAPVRVLASAKPMHVARSVGAKPRVAKPKPHSATGHATAHAASSGPVASIEAVPVAPAKVARPTIRKSRPVRKRAKAIRKVAARPAPKNQNVIRVYDETGKPIN